MSVVLGLSKKSTNPNYLITHVLLNFIIDFQSIAEPNFRYTGAKVVQYLSNELKSIPLFANFRNLFLTR